jgi:dihydroorotate dehydrogenase (fumarate)
LDLSTTYLGLKLGTPIVVGASPFADDVYVARKIQDVGAGAIVMRSLFEEQIYLSELAHAPVAVPGFPGVGKVSHLFPSPSEYQLSPDQYLRQITSLKGALTIPVIASLNGCRPGGWIDFARRFEAAGADAIELNLYHLSSDPTSSSSEMETELLETVRLAKTCVRIPVAVKLQPYFTGLAHFIRKLETIGVDGIVLFNRLFQSDFAVDEEEPSSRLHLSDPTELLLRLRWTAILSPLVKCSIAINGGVHDGKDVTKSILAGADAVQIVSVLLKHGPHALATLTEGLRRWMDEHRYDSLKEFRGKMSHNGADDSMAFERGDYQHLLQGWRI